MDKIIEFEQEIDFSKADQKHLSILQEIVEANVQISVKAEWDLSLITGKEYEHFIVKEEMNSEKKMIVSNELNKDYKESNLTLYPNPTSNILNIDYCFENNSNQNFIEVYDLLGNLKSSIRISSDSTKKVSLDCSSFANGVYSCILKSNGKVLKSSKLVILK